MSPNAACPHPFALSLSFERCPISQYVDNGLVPMNARVMRLLAAGVPLSLLVDLVAPPDSAEILVHEGPRGLPA